jgi:cytoskeletal protein CcmA (bactofilin family)
MTPHSSDDAEEKVTTVIADDLHIKGTITFKTSLMIKGSLEGEIISEGLLVVGPTAKIDATIVTKSLISHGQIKGNVTASDRVVLKGTSVQTGNITTPYIVVENGSTFNGSCVMKREKTATPARETVVEGGAESESAVQESQYEEYGERAAEETARAEEAVGEETAAPAEDSCGDRQSGHEAITQGEGSDREAEGEEKDQQKTKEDANSESPLRSKWRRRELF